MLLKNCPNFFVCLSLCIFPQDFFKNYLQHDKELGFLCCTQSIITLHFSQQTIQSDYLTNFKGGGSFGNRQQQFFFYQSGCTKTFTELTKNVSAIRLLAESFWLLQVFMVNYYAWKEKHTTVKLMRVYVSCFVIAYPYFTLILSHNQYCLSFLSFSVPYFYNLL